MEIHDGLKLEAGNLSHRHRLAGGIQCHIGVRNADISYHEHFIKEGLHDRSGQGRGRSLSVGSGNGDEFALCHMVSQLNLTPDRNLGLIQNRHKRSV